MTQVNTNKLTMKGLHQSQTLSNIELNESYDEVILLLHGYSEDAKRMYKRLGRKVAEKKGSNTLVIAPNGLYPMPKAFPLEKEISNSDDLLQGFAWYFYHAGSNTFLIDYKVPAQTLSQWCLELTGGNKPLTIIGYSQGGYLSPFVAFEYAKVATVKQVIGINCSFREDLMEATPSFPMTLIQGEEDTIIETALAKQRFDKLISRGMTGEYHSIPGADHKLCSKTSDTVLERLK